MKEGWEIKTLGEVCKVVGGGTPSKNRLEFYGGTINWASVRDLNSETLLTTEHTITTLGLSNSSTNLIPKNNVIFASRVGLGKVCITKIDVAINQDLRAPIPKNPNQLDVVYLFRWFQNRRDIIIKAGQGATVQGITLPFINNLTIPLPPLSEQQRIVSIIDEAFEAIDKAIENTQKNLQNAKELFESYSQVVFSNKGGSWEERLLKDVCEYDKTPNKRVDLPYVGLEDIQSNTGVFLGPFEPRNMKSLTFYFNDEHVLYGRLRPYLNKVLQPNFEGHCSTEIFPILPKKNVLDRGFLFQWLIATETMKKINATWSGATLPRANMNAVLEFPINLPSIKDQQSIVRKMDTLSIETKKLESKYQQKLRDLGELKKSILNKAFAGEL